MGKQIINIGASANDNTGDDLRSGGDKINDNFTELYNFDDDSIITNKRNRKLRLKSLATESQVFNNRSSKIDFKGSITSPATTQDGTKRFVKHKSRYNKHSSNK